MAEHRHDIIIPRGMLIAAAGMITAAMLMAGTASVTGVGATRLTLGDATQTLKLRFKDRADGSIAIFDAADDRQIHALGPGDGGFVRVVMRSLAQRRAAAGVGDTNPFHLSRYADGRTALEDPETGNVVTLAAFGHGNAAAFAGLLAKGSNKP